MINVSDLSLQRSSKWLLQDINLTLKPGEKLAVLGPNGAGKSSLLKCISQEIGDYQGKIRLAQRDIQQVSPLERARCMAVMPQKVELSFPFQAKQVVAMGRIPFGDERHCDELIREVMLATDVWSLRTRLYPALSGGEQQRVQLARVLLQIWQSTEQQQCYLLLDECTSALDPAHQHAIMALADQFARKQVAVLAVMHDIALAASWADKVLILNQGKALFSGTTELLASADILQQAYHLDDMLALQYARQNKAWLDAPPHHY